MGIPKLWYPDSLANFQIIFIMSLLIKLVLGGKMKWKPCLQQDILVPHCCLLTKIKKSCLTQSAWGKYCSLCVTSTMVRLSSRSIFRIPSCMRWSLRWISSAENGSSCHKEKRSAFGASTLKKLYGNWQIFNISKTSYINTDNQKGPSDQNCSEEWFSLTTQQQTLNCLFAASAQTQGNSSCLNTLIS